MKKGLILAVVAMIVIGTGFYISSTRKPAVTYKSIPIEKGTIVSSVAATGTLNAVTTVQVGTQVSGTIQRLFVDFNSRVKKGQPIAQIDPALFEAQLQQTRGSSFSAQASVEKAKVSVADAKRSLERNRQLFREGIIAASDLDSAETKYEEARASLRAAEAQVGQTVGSVRQSETNLRYTTIRSPVDGIIISRNVDVGQTVAASFQTPTLFTIAQDLTKMQIDTSIDEADIGRLAEGQPVTFTVDAYPELKFKGKVSQIRNAPIVNQNVVTYNVIITVDNSELKLKPGMTANVTVEVARKDNVLKLPAAALRYKPKKDGDDAAPKGERKKQRPQGQQAYLLSADGNPVAVTVKTGISGEGSLEIIEGKIKEGDKVIIGDSGTKKQGAAQGGGGGMRMGGPRF